MESFVKWLQYYFTVGIWSSASYKNVSWLVKLIVPESKDRHDLALVFDQSHCTRAGWMKDLNKPRFLKELRKIWNSPDMCGIYNSDNTLLIDDSPYKAIRNPPDTALHLVKWCAALDRYNTDLEDDGIIRRYIGTMIMHPTIRGFLARNKLPLEKLTVDDLNEISSDSNVSYNKLEGPSKSFDAACNASKILS
jgi:hypothetical protein